MLITWQLVFTSRHLPIPNDRKRPGPTADLLPEVGMVRCEDSIMAMMVSSRRM